MSKASERISLIMELGTFLETVVCILVGELVGGAIWQWARRHAARSTSRRRVSLGRQVSSAVLRVTSALARVSDSTGVAQGRTPLEIVRLAPIAALNVAILAYDLLMAGGNIGAWAANLITVVTAMFIALLIYLSSCNFPVADGLIVVAGVCTGVIGAFLEGGVNALGSILLIGGIVLCLISIAAAARTMR